jgi:hypothetical protein
MFRAAMGGTIGGTIRGTIRVARVERSETRVVAPLGTVAPGFAALNPGYAPGYAPGYTPDYTPGYADFKMNAWQR